MRGKKSGTETQEDTKQCCVICDYAGWSFNESQRDVAGHSAVALAGAVGLF